MRAPLAPHFTKEAARDINFYGWAEGEGEKKKVAWPHVLAVCMSRLAPAFPFLVLLPDGLSSPPTKQSPHHRPSSFIAPPPPSDVQRHLISLRARPFCARKQAIPFRRTPRSATITGCQLTSRVILISLAVSTPFCAADIHITTLITSHRWACFSTYFFSLIPLLYFSL